MVKLELLHDIECSESSFWKAYFDEALTRRLFLEGLGFRDYVVKSQTEDEKTIVRTVSVEPTLALPGPLVKLLGSQFRYTEEGTFEKATKSFRWKLVPSTLADKIRVDGVMTTTALGDQRTKRRVELVVSADVFMLGRLIEETFAKQLTDGWAKGASVQNQWLDLERLEKLKA